MEQRPAGPGGAQKTRVALVLAAMGAISLSYLGISMSWASSTSSRVEAVAPTMLAAGLPEKKKILAELTR